MVASADGRLGWQGWGAIMDHCANPAPRAPAMEPDRPVATRNGGGGPTHSGCGRGKQRRPVTTRIVRNRNPGVRMRTFLDEIRGLGDVANVPPVCFWPGPLPETVRVLLKARAQAPIEF